MRKVSLYEVLNQRWEYNGPREVCGISGVVTTPPSAFQDQYIPVIYNIPMASSTTTTSAVTLLSAPGTGTYRITVAASQTVVGVGSPGVTTFIPTVVFTDPNSTATSSQALATFATGSGNGTLGYIAPATLGTQSLTFRAKTGTAIQVSIAVTGGGGTTNPSVAVTPIIESLGV